MTKPQRFQLFLYEWFDTIAEHARHNENTLSTEVRQRVARSLWQDRLVEYIAKEIPHAQGDRLATLQELQSYLKTAKTEILNNVSPRQK